VDHFSSIWIKDLLALLMDPELKRQVDEQYSELDLYQQGGISYFKITVDTVFKMSSMTEESLKSFIRSLARIVWPRFQMRMFVSSPSKLMVLLSVWLIQASYSPSPLPSIWRDLPTALSQSSRWFL
jgi:hypothetical protein